jgi:MSHA biogenesis protein MshK
MKPGQWRVALCRVTPLSLLCLPCLLYLLPGLAPAWSEGLPDPTRPANFSASQVNGGNGTNGVPLGEPRLQSILLSRERKLAVINGQSVRLGEKYGDAVLVKLSAGEAVLKTGDQLQTLKLFAALEKKKAEPGKAASTNLKDQ